MSELARTAGRKLVVLGAGGMLGHRVVDAARAAGHDVVGLDRGALDVTDEQAVRARMAEVRPDAVVNCAAWTDVDGAQERMREALEVNANAAGHVARAAAQQGARVVHVSTDYGDGLNVRNWLYVDDFARGIGVALAHGRPGEAYNVGGPDECPNLEVVRRILELTDRDESLIEYVTDRPGHDRRYSLGSEKVRALGWEPQTRFADGLAQTVAWYQDNTWWWQPIRSGDYRAYYERQYGRALG